MGKPPPLPPRRDQTHRSERPQPPDPPAPPKSPPPLPADYLAAHAVRRPIPANPIGIDYGTRRTVTSSRPAILTAVGVISIAIGIFEIIGCFVSIPLVRQLYASAFDPPAIPTRPRPVIVAPPTGQPYDGELKGPEGLTRAEAYESVAAVNSRVPLTPDRATMLRRFMVEFGARVFPPPKGIKMSYESARALITDAGQLPAGPDGLRTRGTHFFRTATGSILIDDASVRYHPADGTAPLRVSNDVATDAQGTRRRCALVVSEEVDQIHRRLGPAFTPTHAAGLAAHRRMPLTSGSASEEAVRGMVGAVRPGDSAQMIGTTARCDATTYVQADGRVITSTLGASPPMGSAVPARTVTPRPAPPAARAAGLVPGARFRASTGWWLIGASVFDALLGAYLIVCGVAVFREWPGTMALHLRYAYPKLAVILLGVWITARYVAELPPPGSRPAIATASSPMAASIAAMTDRTTVWTSTAMGTVLSAIYPVALILLARSPRVLEYYAPRGGEFRVLPAAWRGSAGRAYVEWLRSGRGRLATAVLGGLGLAAAIGHSVLVFTDGSMAGDGHVQWALACGAVGAACVCAALMARRGGAVAAVILLFTLVGLPAFAQQGGAGGTTRPASQPARSAVEQVDFALSRPRLTPQSRAALLPVEPAGRKVAVAELLRRGQGIRFFWTHMPPAYGMSDEKRQAQVAWDVVMVVARASDPAIFELLDDSDAVVRREAAWAVEAGDLGALDEPRRAAIARAAPRLVELIHDRDRRVAEVSSRILASGGDAGWQALYPLLGDENEWVRGVALRRIKDDRRTAIGLTERRALDDHVDELLRQLRMSVYTQASTVDCARTVLRRMGGPTAPAVAPGLKRLRTESPAAYTMAIERLAPDWKPPQSAAAAATRPTPPPRRNAWSQAPAPGENVLQREMEARQAASALAAQIMADPGAADGKGEQAVRDAAEVICRRGVGYFVELTRQAIGEDERAGARARRILEIASKGQMRKDLQYLQSPYDQRLGFSTSRLLGGGYGDDTILIGELWPKLITDNGYPHKAQAARWVQQHAREVRPGPEMREAVRQASQSMPVRDFATWAANPADRVPPPVLGWETGVVRPAAAANAGGASRAAAPVAARGGVPWGVIFTVVSAVILVVGVGGLVLYPMVRPGAEEGDGAGA